jgi:polar amino acid transport system permease protein
MAVCLVASVAIGVVGAWIQGSRLARAAASSRKGYIQFFRNTPPLVQLLFLLFRARLISERSRRATA